MGPASHIPSSHLPIQNPLKRDGNGMGPAYHGVPGIGGVPGITELQLNILRLEGEFRVPPLLVGVRLIFGEGSFKILKPHNHFHMLVCLWGVPYMCTHHIYLAVSGSYRSYGGKILRNKLLGKTSTSRMSEMLSLDFKIDWCQRNIKQSQD